jgi:hypothetical protein
MESPRTIAGLIMLSLLTLLLAACASAPKIASPDDIEAKYKDLYRVTTDNVAATGQSAKTMSAQEYARTGYTLVQERCNTFFDEITKATNDLQMTKADVAALGAAAAVIIALAHRSSKPVAITAAAFGFGTSVFDSYQKYALLTAYPTQTRDLVQAAMEAYAKDSPAADAKDIVEADARISGYAQLCTYSGIVALAAKAISTSAPKAVSQTASSVFTTADDVSKVTQIKTLLGLPDVTLSDNTLALLELMADPSTADALRIQIPAQLPSDVAAKVWSSDTNSKLAALDKIAPLLSQLATSNKAFAQIIAGIKKASTSRPGDVNAAPTLVVPAGPPGPWSPPIITINGVR